MLNLSIKFPYPLKFIWNSLKNLRISFFIFLILTIIYGTFDSVLSYSTKLLLDNFEDVTNPDFIKNLYYSSIRIIIVIAFFEIVNKSSYFFLKIKVLPSLYKNIVSNTFSKVLSKDYSFFNKILSGNIASKIDDLGNGSCGLITYFIDYLMYRLSVGISSIFAIFVVSKDFGFVILGLLIFFMTIGYFIITKIIKQSKVLAESHSSLLGKILNSLTNITTIKLFHTIKTENLYTKDLVEKNYLNSKKLQILNLYMFICFGFLFLFIISSALPFVIQGKINNILTIGEITVLLSLSVKAANSILGFAFNMTNLSEIYGKFSRALDVLKLDDDRKLLSNNNKVYDQNSKEIIENSKDRSESKEITFQNISFSYDKDDEQKKSLNNLSINIPKNQKIALIGESGSGKSTFLNLFMKLYRIERGDIFIDKKNINDFSDKSFYEKFSFVPQNIILFNRTIKDNILYSKVDATPEEIIDAAKNAQIHDYIMTLPNQYETIVDEGGTNISGGQRQRIALARAFLKNAPIFIMDEGLSALDEVTKSKLESYLSEFMKEKTSLIITHDLSFLDKVDRILFFHEFEIIGDGNYEELFKKNERFRKFLGKKLILP